MTEKHLIEQYIKIGFTWACKQATIWGWKWSYEGNMIWVNTGSSEIGCDGRQDFTSLTSEHNSIRTVSR